MLFSEGLIANATPKVQKCTKMLHQKDEEVYDFFLEFPDKVHNVLIRQYAEHF